MALEIKAAFILGLALFSLGAEGKSRRGLTDAGTTVFDVTKYEAKADGRTDSAMAMIRAWNAACKSAGPAKLLIPPGKFMAGEIVFAGPCTAKPLIIELQGDLIARTDLSLFTTNTWISIEHVDGLEFTGTGTINGQGEASWKYHAGGSDNHLPDSLVFMHSTNSKIENVQFVNSKGFHMKVVKSQGVNVNNLKITAPGDSPNTDGIHISGSTNVHITSTVIGTGDDCISIGDGNTDIFVTDVTCGPGHGISVGSLGKRPNEENVKGVTVSNCTLIGTTNGARIKSYRESPKLTASGIIFEDLIMDSVKNPIIIDQNYASKGRKGGSNVKISDVHFRKIRGTTISNVAVSLTCSEVAPCEGVEVADIDLTLTGNSKASGLSSQCVNAIASFAGLLNPVACA